MINKTSQLGKHGDDNYEIMPATNCLKSDTEAENNCKIFAGMLNDQQISFASKLILGYISGYISRILTRYLKCEECVDSFSTTDRLPHHKLIVVKDIGGLLYSTEDVYKICVKVVGSALKTILFILL